MKPLPAVPLTPEDFWIWDSVVHRCGGEGIAYKLATLHADRRDADLMYVGASSRGVVTWNNLDPEPTLVLLRGAPLC